MYNLSSNKNFYFKKYDVTTNGQYPKKLTKKIIRPKENCISCGKQFINSDPFHYTKQGPIHGWGSFESDKTCYFAKVRQHIKPNDNTIKSNTTTNNKSNNNFKSFKHPYKTNKCVECGYKIEKYENSHITYKGSIHGAGFKDDYGTCIHKFRHDLEIYLNQKTDEYVKGNMNDNEMVELIKETTDKENGFRKYNYEITKAVREASDNKNKKK